MALVTGPTPYDHDSGLYKGERHIWGGRRSVRDGLYMAALGALRSKNSIFKAFYERLIAKGKKPKVAIIAVARKLITTLNAMLRDNQPWRTA